MPHRVSSRHIGLLVDTLLATDVVPGLNGPDVMGQALAAANYAALAHRYDTTNVDDDLLYTYERADDGVYRRVGAAFTYKQVECFVEQCHDWPGWSSSAVSDWMAALADHLLVMIRTSQPRFDGKRHTCHEYETAPWGVPEDYDQI